MFCQKGFITPSDKEEENEKAKIEEMPEEVVEEVRCEGFEGFLFEITILGEGSRTRSRSQGFSS